MTEIIKFPGLTKGEIPTEDVLDNAKHLETALVMGIDESGEFYAASTTGDVPALLYLMEKFKHNLMGGDYD